MTGDIDASLLGATDYHEHMFQVSRMLPGEDLDDEELSGGEAAQLRASGFAAMVDATPIGLGRRPGSLARISRAAGIHIVAATGLHKKEHYADGHWVLEAPESELASWMAGDVIDGIAATDDDPRRCMVTSSVRAGIVKVGIGYWRIGTFERRAIAASGEAHGRTGAPVMVHLDHGSAAREVLELLGSEGVPADAVVLAHIDRNPDPHLHADLAQSGAYLGYDGFARHREWPDSVLIDCLLAAADAGAAERIVLGGDVARRSRYRAYGGLPGLAYLGDRVVPRIRERAGDVQLGRFLVDNPARLLARVLLP